MRILIVCTANVCRSPMAGAILESLCARESIAAAITTAGLESHGRPVDPRAVAAMEGRGLDISRHRPRTITAGEVEETELILTMTRDHVRTIASGFPGSFSRAFTLKEASRRVREIPAGSGFDVSLLHLGRSASDLLGESEIDDIADPFGGAPNDYRTCIDEIDASLTALIESWSGVLQ